MEQRDHQNADVSKTRQAQQPQVQQQPEMDQQSQPDTDHLLQSGAFQTHQPDTSAYERGEAGYAGELEADTLAGQRSASDIEGSADTGESIDSEFIGTEGFGDTSSELIEDEGSDFARDSRGVTE